ncbi:MAG TPA: hypothetical protein VGV61_12760, partial [Thermoanaerobaculia bacterium]|nr:hypothetical protein [Thermoanaerobaculia bacterium]
MKLPPGEIQLLVRGVVSAVSLCGFLSSAAMFLFILGMGGFGASRANPWVVALLAMPAPVFLFCFLSCFAFVRGRVLAVGMYVVPLGTLAVAIFLFANGGPGLAAGPIVVAFTGLWV